MNTITIEDPRDADAAVKAAFPDALIAYADFGLRGDGEPEWCFTAFFLCSGLRPVIRGYGSTIEKALEALKAEYAKTDPDLALEAEANKRGFTLTPLPV